MPSTPPPPPAAPATPSADVLRRLAGVVRDRRNGGSADDSYIARLVAKGRKKVAQKVGEEGVEVAIAAVCEGPQDLINESADLLFHLLVLWEVCGVTLDDVLAEMERREGMSGLDEKRRRKQ